MKIDSSILYAPCPCGSGKKFKFCCWPKCRDSFNDDMTKAQFVQTVRCTAVGIYDNMNASEGGEVCERGRQNLLEGRFEKARPLFRKARTLDSKMWVAWNNEAICAWETGFVEEAYDLQRKGIEVAAPLRNTYGCASMAVFSHVLGRDDEAAEWLERALADKLPLGRDVVVRVCYALALFRRHRAIVGYTSESGMDDDGQVAFFKGTALANLGELVAARDALAVACGGFFGPIAEHYYDCISDKVVPWSAYDGEWPYFWSGNFAPARWFEEDLKAGRDPFVRYPNAAPDAIETLIADKLRTAGEMLKVLKGRTGERVVRLRNALKELASEEIGSKGIPKGVKEMKDPDRLPILRPIPKWRMEYQPSTDDEPEDSADAMIGGFAKPYVERYCSIAAHKDPDKFEIAILQMSYGKDKAPTDCPSVTIVPYGELWEYLHAKLTEYFGCFGDPVFMCEVRYDQMYGGPILNIEDDRGRVESFMIAIPHFGEE